MVDYIELLQLTNAEEVVRISLFFNSVKLTNLSNDHQWLQRVLVEKLMRNLVRIDENGNT